MNTRKRLNTTIGLQIPAKKSELVVFVQIVQYSIIERNVVVLTIIPVTR